MIEVHWEPFDRVALDTVGIWFVGTFVACYVVENIHTRLFGVVEQSHASWLDLFSGAVIAAPVIEEVIFRMVPYIVTNGSIHAIGIASAVWAMLHDRPLVILVTVPLFVKLAGAGLFWWAMGVHALHNGILFAVMYWTYDPDDETLTIESEETTDVHRGTTV